MCARSRHRSTGPETHPEIPLAKMSPGAAGTPLAHCDRDRFGDAGQTTAAALDVAWGELLKRFAGLVENEREPT